MISLVPLWGDHSFVLTENYPSSKALGYRFYRTLLRQIEIKAEKSVETEGAGEYGKNSGFCRGPGRWR